MSGDQESFLSQFKRESELRARFGKIFFSQIPQKPGVYFFKDELGQILYVGKAKNLRKRIQSYQQIRFDRSSRKLTRLVRFTRQIDWELCADETAALLRENHYLRSLKPLYNRMNTKPEYYWYLHLIWEDLRWVLRFSKQEHAEALATFGAFKAKNRFSDRLKSVVRLFHFYQFRIESGAERYQVPHQFLRWRNEYEVGLARQKELHLLTLYLSGKSSRILEKIRERFEAEAPSCEFSGFILRNDFEIAKELFEGFLQKHRQLARQAGTTFVPKEELDDQLVLSEMGG